MSAYIAAPLQLDKICRACLTGKGDMKPLYNDCLDEMLNSFVFIQAQPDDGLPSLLCAQCVMQCSAACTFKQLCEKSDNILHEFIKPEFQVQLHESVMPIDSKVEVDKSCEVDQYTEMSNHFIKELIKSEFDSCTDSESDLKRDQNSTEQPDNDRRMEINKARQLVVRIEVLPTHKQLQPRDQCDKIADKPLLCSVCNKGFKWPSNLKLHMRYHFGNLLNCNYCDKKFVEARKLKLHVQTHTGERPHVCQTCGKAYATPYTLIAHQRVHTGEKPYKCNICDKCFSRSNFFLKHKRMHTGIKSHYCSICGKGFYSSKDMWNHRKNHSKEKHHQCNMCEKKFARTNELTVHMKRHLKREDKERQKEICNKNFKTGTEFEKDFKFKSDGQEFLENESKAVKRNPFRSSRRQSKT